MKKQKDIILDPMLRNYVYAAAPLVNIFEAAEGKKTVAKMLMGEWMKITSPESSILADERVKVVYRGGEGFVNSADLTRERCLEIYFLDVDQGDSILIQTPDDRRVLIDGGEDDSALSFLRNKYHLDKPDKYIDLEAVVATHSDLDHTGGLIKILRHPQIAVKRVFHNGLFRRTLKTSDPGPRIGNRLGGLEDYPQLPGSPELSHFMKKFIDAVKQAEKRLPRIIKKMESERRWHNRLDLPPGGFICRRLDAADQYLPPYGKDNKYLQIKVLWPCADAAGTLPRYPSKSETVNGNSIVLKLIHGNNSVLLTGDLNEKSMDDIISHYSQAGRLDEWHSDIYKAAHHGSQHFSVPFLKLISPDAAVISSGDNRFDKHGHPSAVLLGTITRFSKIEKPAIFSTELAACFRKLSPSQQAEFNSGHGHLYERAIQGIIHLRSNGKQMHLGRVFGRRPPKDPHAQTLWKWDVWSKPLRNKKAAGD
ncbi:MBL fold metallo-hydrolase [Lentisphaerota bacterium ZTH]|nr:MBL fold metallo-hydrolase [Lentisphaerota bacterium]WET05249.1 MBL fold metallo-hydrolase [Lentisphaerota bacterium ZTH]